MVRRLLAAAAAVVLLAASGCAPQGVPDEPVTFSPTPTPDLLSARNKAGIAACPTSDPDVATVSNGLPDVTLDCIGGDSQVRLAGLRGRPMIVNVWAQWCEPCRVEAPYLREFAAQAPASLLILGVNYNDPRPDYAIEFAANAGWKYPHVVDPGKALAGPLKIAGPPQTFFVTADGAIVYRHLGAFTSTEQIAALARAHLGVG